MTESVCWPAPTGRRCLAALRAAAVSSICIAVWPGHVDAQQPPSSRPRVGVAFGGGSACGFAHVGVIGWFEEHRIPIDVVAGTSMGGLIGGGFASGMSADELERLLAGTNWTQMFGASSYRFKNIMRKQDARDYPSYFEFGLKRGLRFPPSLNNGQQVDLLFAGLMAPYAGLQSFDDLPTPFRWVAVDLKSANQVVLDRGSSPEPRDGDSASKNLTDSTELKRSPWHMFEAGAS